MKMLIKSYMAMRAAVMFMARPLFYLIFYPIVLGAAVFLHKDNIIQMAAVYVMESMESAANMIMFGRGYETPDLLVMLCAVLPTVIAAAWAILERASGVHYLLKSNGFIR